MFTKLSPTNTNLNRLIFLENKKYEIERRAVADINQVLFSGNC